MRTALKWAGLWVLMAFFVALLTIIFSFLGAIFCAGLAGMMMGATRHARWQTIPLAIVPPAVLWLVLHLGKAELPTHQVHVLMVICFATFWLTYGVGVALVLYERSGRAAAKPRAEAQPGTGNELAVTKPSGTARASGSPVAPVTTSAGALTLRELQGKWWHQVAALRPQEPSELMEIVDTRLTWSAIGSDGRVRQTLQGELRVESAQPFRALVVSGSQNQWPADLSVII